MMIICHEDQSKLILPSLVLCRVVTKISSCRVNTTSRRGIKRRGISFGSIFLLFSKKSSQGATLLVAGENPRPLALNDNPDCGYITFCFHLTLQTSRSLYCSVCFQRCTKSNTSSAACGHVFCDDCWLLYCISQLKIGLSSGTQ